MFGCMLRFARGLHRVLRGTGCDRAMHHSSADVEQEKQHNALLEGVEKFDADRLKKTETQEKNRLPSPDGKPQLASCGLNSDRARALKSQ